MADKQTLTPFRLQLLQSLPVRKYGTTTMETRIHLEKMISFGWVETEQTSQTYIRYVRTPIGDDLIAGKTK